jgi:recombinational DNA repair protein (RecF pathway)
VPRGEAVETMPSIALPSSGFERALLRKSGEVLSYERPRCVHCHRTPLVGERVHLYAERIVCELCRPRRPEAPERSELVRSPEHKRAVRVRSR